jgi:hypothetical protein
VHPKAEQTARIALRAVNPSLGISHASAGQGGEQVPWFVVDDKNGDLQEETDLLLLLLLPVG